MNSEVKSVNILPNGFPQMGPWHLVGATMEITLDGYNILVWQCSTSVDNVLSRKYVQEVLQCATRGFGPCWPFMWLAILFSMSLSSMFRKGSICLVSCCDVFRKMSC